MHDRQGLAALRWASRISHSSNGARPRLRHARSVTFHPRQADAARLDSSVIGLPHPPGSSSEFPSSGHPFAEHDDLFNNDSSAMASEPLASVPDSIADSLGHSDAEPDASNMAVARVALRQPWNMSARRRRHPFDSHGFVSRLEKATLDAQTSKALMEGVRGVIVRRTGESTAKMLSREEADNEAYVFRAALSKLRTEVNVRTRNTGLVARNSVSAVRRELEHLDRQMAGDMQVLKHDVEMDMNNSKDENRNDKKTMYIQIEEINSRATISIGDLRVEIESAKWDSTRKAITIIIVLVISGVGISTLTFGADKTKATTPPPPPPKVEETTTRDVGIGTDDDALYDDYEARIDKILSAVPPPEPRERRPRRHSKPEVWDRI